MGEPWTPQERDDNEALKALWNEAHQLAMSVWQVADSGDEAQQQAVAELLADTKRNVYLTLAGDTPTTE